MREHKREGSETMDHGYEAGHLHYHAKRHAWLYAVDLHLPAWSSPRTTIDMENNQTHWLEVPPRLNRKCLLCDEEQQARVVWPRKKITKEFTKVKEGN